MKIYLGLFTDNQIVPYSPSTTLEETTDLAPAISDKDLIKKYPIGEKLAKHIERKWKSKEPISTGIPEEFDNPLSLLHPIFEMMEDHDIQYVDDSALKSLVERVKNNPLKYSYDFKDFLKNNPPDVPLSYSIPLNIDSYFYTVGYTDGLYTIAINRLFPENPNYRRDIELGVFAGLHGFINILNKTLDTVYTSGLQTFPSVATPIFHDMLVSIEEQHNYLVIKLGIDPALVAKYKNKDKFKHVVSYLGAYHYMAKYFLPFIDSLLTKSNVEVYNEGHRIREDALVGYKRCLGFRLDSTIAMEEFSTMNYGANNQLSLVYDGLIKSAYKHYDAVDAVFECTEENRKKFGERVKQDANLMSALRVFYEKVLSEYENQRQAKNKVIDELEKAVKFFNSKTKGSCVLTLGGSENIKSDFVKFKKDRDLFFFSYAIFLKNNEDYVMNPEGFLFDIAPVRYNTRDGANHEEIKFESRKVYIYNGLNFKDFHTDYGKPKALGCILSSARDFFELIELGKKEPNSLYNDWGLELFIKAD